MSEKEVKVGLKLPKFPDWSELEDVQYEDSFWNDQDISNLNKTLVQTALQLKEVNKQITYYEREKVKKEIIYKKKYREALHSSNARTETQKKQMAELACEEIEYQIMYLDEVVKELTRISGTLRVDLDTLKTIGHNLRQELRII